jgi:hypothetical protein
MAKNFPDKLEFSPGTVLAACINIQTPIAAQYYRAEFEQAVNMVQSDSGPQVLQLDGYPNANCTN